MNNGNLLDNYFQGKVKAILGLEGTKNGFESRYFCHRMVAVVYNKIRSVAVCVL
jgi:hypothetical protein